MQPQQLQGQEQPPLPPLIPPPPTHSAQTSSSASPSPASSFASAFPASHVAELPVACRVCPSAAQPGCVHGRCALCCRAVGLHCPPHEGRPSLVGARFAAVLDGSVTGGLRLTAQLGDRIYRGVLFTAPVAVRIQRTPMAAGTGNGAVPSSAELANGSSAVQQQPAKRHKAAPGGGSKPSVSEASSSPTVASQHIAEHAPAANNHNQPP